MRVLALIRVLPSPTSISESLRVRFFGEIRIWIFDTRSLGSWCIKGTDESTLGENRTSLSQPRNLGFQWTRRSHDYKFMPLSSSVNAYSFFPRAIPVWNGLPSSVIHASSVNHFKASIVLNQCYFITFLSLLATCVIVNLVLSIFSSMYCTCLASR